MRHRIIVRCSHTFTCLYCDELTAIREEESYFPFGRGRRVAAVERVRHRGRGRFRAVHRAQADGKISFGEAHVRGSDQPPPFLDAIPFGQHVHGYRAAGHVIDELREVQLGLVVAVERRRLFAGQAQHVLLRYSTQHGHIILHRHGEKTNCSYH